MSTTNENIKTSHGGGTDKPKIPFKNWVANGSHKIKAFGTKLSNSVRDRFKWLTKAFKRKEDSEMGTIGDPIRFQRNQVELVFRDGPDGLTVHLTVKKKPAGNSAPVVAGVQEGSVEINKPGEIRVTL